MATAAEESVVGVYDLKTHLSSVLERVIAGQVVTVTRHGHAIARILPVSESTPTERRAAIQRIRAARRGRTLGMSAKDAINEGRT